MLEQNHEKSSDQLTDGRSESSGGQDKKRQSSPHGDPDTTSRVTGSDHRSSAHGGQRGSDTGQRGSEQEASMLRKVQEARRRQQERVYSTRAEPDERLSRANAIKLMRMYERRAKEAEVHVSQLRSELEESQSLCTRYHNLYLNERNRNSSPDRPKSHAASLASDRKSPRNSEKKDERKSEDGKGKDKKSTEEDKEKDLNDDEALFKRHVAMIAESKAMRTTSPIRVTDVIRKSEALIMENQALRQKIQRLQYDNTQLIRKVRSSGQDREKLLHSVSTSEFARNNLQKRLDQEKKEFNRLNRSLNRQASDWIEYRKEMQEMEERRRWAALGYIKAMNAEPLRQSPKSSMYKPRGAFPMENTSNRNKQQTPP